MNVIQKGQFYRVPCFNEKDSKILSDRVLNLRDHFTERNKITDEVVVDSDSLGKPTPFYTLGTSTYLDLKGAHGDAAASTNKILLENFSDMYELLIPCLSEALNEKVMFLPNLNIPGFHIFDARNLPKPGVSRGGSIHRDYPDYSAEFDFNYIRSISFTVILRAPAKGAGLNYWDDKGLSEEITYFQTFCKMPKEMYDRVKIKFNYFEYKVGELVIHDGGTLHQVANMVDTEDGEYRISIQGHGVLTEEGYVIYF